MPAKKRPEENPDFWEKTFGNPIQINMVHRKQYDKRYQKRRASPSKWESLGKITHLDASENTINATAKNGYAQYTWLSSHIIRVRIAQNPITTEKFSYLIDPNNHFKPSQIHLVEHKNSHEINGSYYITQDGSLQFSPQHTISVKWSKDGSSQIIVTCPSDEVFYGTGERTFDLNLRGRELTFWNTDAGSYDRGLEPVNYTIPFYVGMSNEAVYGVFADNTFRGKIALATNSSEEVAFTFEGGEICFYLIQAKTLEGVVESFSVLTGKMNLPPLWSLGFQQSRYSYFTQEEVLSIARTFRERNIPCDVLYLDIHYMQDFKVFTWDKNAFPDFKSMIDELHSMGFKLVVILDPGIKVEKGDEIYEDGIQEDIFMKYPDETPCEGVVWPGLTHHPDFTNPKARTWWAKHLQPLIDAGVDGLWNDMNEPLYFFDKGAVSPPDYAIHNKEGLGGTHHELHNVYGMQMARASFEALKQARPNRRVFNLTRSGNAGTPRYASSWTGDNKSTWDDLRLTIPMNLNMGISGQSFTGPDVGGFALNTTPELVTRWTQACAFFPYFRNHSAVDTIRQEIWLFGAQLEGISRSAIELRYRFMPYLYTTFAECAFYGTPILRPIAALEPQNSVIRQIDDCYLVGNHLLVAPVLSPHTLRRTVYLPSASGWYNYHTGSYHLGGQWITVESPLEILPLFVRAGTVLPQWELQQHLTKPAQQVQLTYYAGNGVTKLYEDSGEGYDYLTGSYRWTTFATTSNANSTVITRHIEGNLLNAPRHELLNPPDNALLVGF